MYNVKLRSLDFLDEKSFDGLQIKIKSYQKCIKTDFIQMFSSILPFLQLE